MTVDASRLLRIEALDAAAAERILVLDGDPWGAKIQDLALTEEEFRGERFVFFIRARYAGTPTSCA